MFCFFARLKRGSKQGRYLHIMRGNKVLKYYVRVKRRMSCSYIIPLSFARYGHKTLNLALGPIDSRETQTDRN